ncbi:hypothetical protein [Cupriavidus sp.]|uniref:hypothetical protein n=1 Tax=Cupriavidus sp. TaxID=1873897 RepID=UPI0028BDBEEF|nr:hypothetical protein [Cupriavidus sp.]
MLSYIAARPGCGAFGTHADTPRAGAALSGTFRPHHASAARMGAIHYHWRFPPNFPAFFARALPPDYRAPPCPS